MAQNCFLDGTITIGDQQEGRLEILTRLPTGSRYNWSILKGLWGARIGFIAQEPLASLAPYYRVKEQLDDIIKSTGPPAGMTNILRDELLRRVHFPAHRSGAFPEQLSGGESQRASIAMAIAPDPKILIADEPTTGLDLLIQRKVIATLLEILEQHRQMSLIFVTHSLGLLNQVLAGQGTVLVFFQGHLLESFQLPVGACLHLHALAHHPYTVSLLYQFLDHYAPEDVDFAESYLNTYAGDLSKQNATVANGPGCPYLRQCPVYRKMTDEADRYHWLAGLCRHSVPPCRAVTGVFPWQSVACHLDLGKHDQGRIERPCQVVTGANSQTSMSGPRLVQVRGLCSGYLRQRAAISDICFAVDSGDHLGIVGETGSGKSTLARCLSAVPLPDQWTDGVIEWHHQGRWQDIAALDGEALRKYRNLHQLVWQQPSQVFTWAENIATLLQDACQVWAQLWQVPETRDQQRQRQAAILEQLVLPDPTPEWTARHPSSLSGGQRKRLLVARSLLACGFPNQTPGRLPRLFCLDEPLRGIDVINKGRVIRCLQRAATALDATLVVISHDLRIVRHLCRRLLVLYQGRIVQEGAMAAIIDADIRVSGRQQCHHPYTLDLIAAIPRIDSFWHDQPFIPADNQSDNRGCAYRPLCSRYHRLDQAASPLANLCRTTVPQLRRITDCDSKVACHAAQQQD